MSVLFHQDYPSLSKRPPSRTPLSLSLSQSIPEADEQPSPAQLLRHFQLDPLLAPAPAPAPAPALAREDKVFYSTVDRPALRARSQDSLLDTPSIGPLDYPPPPNDPWVIQPAVQSGIPRSLSLQEISTVPWASSNQTQSLYSEPVLPPPQRTTSIDQAPNYSFINSLYSSAEPYDFQGLSNPRITTPGNVGPLEEISTIFVVGFPEDMDEREFQNMFIFSQGFEAASLKIPATTLASRSNPSDPSYQQQQQQVFVDQFGMALLGGYEDFGLINGHQGIINKKQIIGFAKFKTREDAIRARDVLSGRRVDAEKGSVLKAEMAKKNLHTKRGLSLSVDQLSLSATTTNPISFGYPNAPVAVEERIGNGVSRPRSLSTHFDALSYLPSSTNASNGLHNLIGPEAPRRATIDSHSRLPIDFSAFIATPTPHHPLYVAPPTTAACWSAPLEQGFGAPPPPASHVFFTHPSNCSSSDTSSNSASSSLKSSSLTSPPSCTATPNTYNLLLTNHNRSHYPADQNPAINTLYVGGLPTLQSSSNSLELEERLKKVFEAVEGFKRFSFRCKNGQPMCFVEFLTVKDACLAMEKVYGNRIGGLVPGGIRLAFSRNALGVRSNPGQNMALPNINQIGQQSQQAGIAGFGGPPPPTSTSSVPSSTGTCTTPPTSTSTGLNSFGSLINSSSSSSISSSIAPSLNNNIHSLNLLNINSDQSASPSPMSESSPGPAVVSSSSSAVASNGFLSNVFGGASLSIS